MFQESQDLNVLTNPDLIWNLFRFLHTADFIKEETGGSISYRLELYY